MRDFINLGSLQGVLFILLVVVLCICMGCRDAYLSLVGNLQLVECIEPYLNGEPKLDPCKREIRDQPQLETITYTRERILFETEGYGQILEDCRGEVCHCPALEPARAISFHEQLRNLYRVASQGIIQGRIPTLEGCRSSLAPSPYIWRGSLQVRAKGKEDLADRMREIAYRIDLGWRDQWERGLCAFKQAGQYYSIGEFLEAKIAFGVAIDSFLQASDDRAAAYLSWSHTGQADAKRGYGDLSGAEEGYLRAIAISPQQGRRAYKELARLWLQRGFGFDYVLHRFESIRQSLDPGDPYLSSGPAYALIELSSIDAAAEFIESAGHATAMSAVIQRVKGVMCEQLGDMNCALDYYTRASELLLDDNQLQAAELAADRGRVTSKLGDSHSALSHYEEATRLNPESISYWLRLAKTFEELGDVSNARRILDEALSLHPWNEALRSALMELEGSHSW